MTGRRALLDCAAFMDSEHSRVPGLERDAVREVAQRFLAACHEDLGCAPRDLDGEGLRTVLGQVLPRRFGVRDTLAAHTEDVLHAFLQFLEENEVVADPFSLRLALSEGAPVFLRQVQDGAAHPEGQIARTPGTTVQHRGQKVGRNDPCPCGSGRKFKKCCKPIGE